MSKQPAQPGQPAHVRPTATRSNNFGGRTRVPTFLTWPQWVGSGFPLSKHVKLDLPLSFNFSSDLLSIPNQIRWNLAEICQDLVQTLQDSARSCLCSMKSRPDLDRSGQILIDPAKSCRIWPDIDKFSQISALVIKSETNSIKPETDKTQTGRSNQIIWANFGLYFP